MIVEDKKDMEEEKIMLKDGFTFQPLPDISHIQFDKELLILYGQFLNEAWDEYKKELEVYEKQKAQLEQEWAEKYGEASHKYEAECMVYEEMPLYKRLFQYFTLHTPKNPHIPAKAFYIGDKGLRSPRQVSVGIRHFAIWLASKNNVDQ